MLNNYTFYENKNNKYTIYCDMDGVLTDFDEMAKKLNPDIFNFEPKEMWKKIANAGTPFWSKMNWTKDGQELWNFLKKYNVKILTGLPGLSKNDWNRKYSEEGKETWIRNNLGEDVFKKAILTTTNEKKKYAKPNSILIDDNLDTIKSWEKKGGIGIHHISSKKTIEKIKEFLDV